MNNVPFQLDYDKTKYSEFLFDIEKSELNDKRAEYIKNLIKTASNLDYNKKIFGSSSHKYKLNPVLSLEDVKKFENNNNITLPEEYVFFITHVGNGGAGPYYGIIPLNINDINKNLSLTPFARNDMTDDEWNNYLEGDYDYTNDFENGVLEICSQGCTFVTWLVLTGNDKGKIIYADLNMDTSKPYFINMGFLEWFEGWFEEIIKGYNIYNYGYHYNGSQKEILEKFYKVENDNKLKALFSLNKFKSLDTNTIDFLHKHYNSEYKLYILNLLLKYDNDYGIEKFEQELKSNNPCIAVEVFYSLNKIQKINYYYKMLDIMDKVTPELQKKILSFFYFAGIDNDIKFKVETFKKFADNEKYDIKVRKAALRVMRYTINAHEHLPYFIEYLHSDNIELIEGSLTVVYLFKDEKLLKEFERLLKYKNVDEIRDLLSYAFRRHNKEITDYMTIDQLYDDNFIYKID